MVSFKTERGLPLVALLSYVVFIPSTLFCSVGMLTTALMGLGCLVTIVMELFRIAEKHLVPNDVSDGHSLVHDVVVVLRVLSTTLLPAALASFGGASFLLMAQLRPSAGDCTVADLQGLAAQGFASFACSDGFVPVDMQVGVPAWQDQSSGGRRLLDPEATLDYGKSRTVGWSDGHRFGFVAPLFESREKFSEGAPPVAWAVKAGSPVRRSQCFDGRLAGTCGFFAARLRGDWLGFPAPSFFGQGWGFNITHFSTEQMSRAVREVRNQQRSLPDNFVADQTFVIVESAESYFGTAFPFLYVVITLLSIGLLDRLSDAADSRVLLGDNPRQTLEYDRLVMQQTEPQQSIWDQVAGFWNDPLNTEAASEHLKFERTVAIAAHPGTQPGSLQPSPRLSVR